MILISFYAESALNTWCHAMFNSAPPQPLVSPLSPIKVHGRLRSLRRLVPRRLRGSGPGQGAGDGRGGPDVRVPQVLRRRERPPGRARGPGCRQTASAAAAAAATAGGRGRSWGAGQQAPSQAEASPAAAARIRGRPAHEEGKRCCRFPVRYTRYLVGVGEKIDIVSWYFAWQYCTDTRMASIDILYSGNCL